jgi:hypothetical protein
MVWKEMKEKVYIDEYIGNLEVFEIVNLKEIDKWIRYFH